MMIGISRVVRQKNQDSKNVFYKVYHLSNTITNSTLAKKVRFFVKFKQKANYKLCF